MEVVWSQGLIVFWLDLKIYCICCLRSNVSIKYFRRRDSLACTFIRSLLHFFSPAFLISKMTMMVFEFSGNFCTAMHVANRVFFSFCFWAPSDLCNVQCSSVFPRHFSYHFLNLFFCSSHGGSLWSSARESFKILAKRQKSIAKDSTEMKNFEHLSFLSSKGGKMKITQASKKPYTSTCQTNT